MSVEKLGDVLYQKYCPLRFEMGCRDKYNDSVACGEGTLEGVNRLETLPIQQM